MKGNRIGQSGDAKITGGEVWRPWNIFAIHSSQRRYLTVGGRTYRGVRGSSPYYLDIPGTNAVLFVTEKSGNVAFHIVSPQNDGATEIDGKGSTFGWGIGSKRTNGEPFTDWIESATAKQILLATRTDSLKVTTLLDLSKKVVVQVEVLFLDATGSATNRVVYPKE